MRILVIIVVTGFLQVCSLVIMLQEQWAATIAQLDRHPAVKQRTGDRVMDAKWIIEMTRVFLRKSFGVAEALVIFGPVKINTVPDSVYLQPKDHNYENVSLDMYGVEGSRIPESIAIKLIKTELVDFQRIIDTFGPPRELPRLHPDQPITYSFDIQGEDFKGSLKIGLRPGEGRMREMKTVRFTRYLE